MRPALLVLLVSFGMGANAQYLADNRQPNPADEFYRAGEKAYRNGDHRMAVQLFTKVLEIDADHVNAMLQRGFCHTLLAEYDMAVADFTAVIERKPEHAWAYTSRGSAHAKSGRHDLAIADFEQVIALDPKNTEAYNNRGWSRKALGDEQGACKDWKTSQRLGNGEARIIQQNNRCK